MLKTISLIALMSVLIAVVCSEETAPVAQQAAVTPFQCYTCNSNDDKSCAGDKSEKYSGSESHKQACTNGETFCRKIIQIVDGERSIVRQCAKELYKPKYTGCYKTAGKSTQQVCTCEGSLCNNAITFKSSFLAVSLSIVIASLFL